MTEHAAAKPPKHRFRHSLPDERNIVRDPCFEQYLAQEFAKDKCPITLKVPIQLGNDAYESCVDQVGDKGRIYSARALSSWLHSKQQQKFAATRGLIYTSPVTRKDMAADALALAQRELSSPVKTYRNNGIRLSEPRTHAEFAGMTGFLQTTRQHRIIGLLLAIIAVYVIRDILIICSQTVVHGVTIRPKTYLYGISIGRFCGAVLATLGPASPTKVFDSLHNLPHIL